MGFGAAASSSDGSRDIGTLWPGILALGDEMASVKRWIADNTTQAIA